MSTTERDIVRDVRRYLVEYYSGRDVQIIRVFESSETEALFRRIRVQWRYVGVDGPHEYFNAELDVNRILQRELHEFNATLALCREFAREINNHREEFMAQWNQRNTQRLQQQERQRREARGQTAMEQAEIRPMNIRGHGETLRTYYDDLETFNTARPGPGGRAIGGRGGGGGPSTFATTGNTYINTGNSWYTVNNQSNTDYQPTLTQEVVEQMIKQAIQTKLESLDIRISLDESDGEVSADVEILLDGKVIGSDSDSITICGN